MTADLDLLLDVWRQFAHKVPGSPGYRHDGGLSVLEAVCARLVDVGRLRQIREDRDWFVEIDTSVPTSAPPAPTPANPEAPPSPPAEPLRVYLVRCDVTQIDGRKTWFVERCVTNSAECALAMVEGYRTQAPAPLTFSSGVIGTEPYSPCAHLFRNGDRCALCGWSRAPSPPAETAPAACQTCGGPGGYVERDGLRVPACCVFPAPAVPEVDLGEVPDLLLDAVAAGIDFGSDRGDLNDRAAVLTAKREGVISAVRSLVERARREDFRVLEAAAEAQTKPERWAVFREAADMLRALTPAGPGAADESKETKP